MPATDWPGEATAAAARPRCSPRELAPGSASSEPQFITAVGERAFFAADDGVNGRELWVLSLASGVEFRRGDSNADGTTDISDAVTILGFLFLGGRMNDCRDAADVNDDGKVDISDPVSLLGHLFLSAAQPPDPFRTCGADRTEDQLDCKTFSKCP